MTRVLLITDPTADFECRHVASQLLRAGNRGFQAESFELPPAGATPVAIRKIMQRDRAAEFDVLHAFGPRALLSVAAVGCQPIVYSPPSDEPRHLIGRRNWIGRLRQVTVVCTSRAASREIDSTSCRVIPPYVDSAAPQSISRGELGLAADDRVLLAIGESTHASRHKLVIWTAVILHFLDRRYRLLLWGRGPTAQSIQRFAAALKQPDLCVLAEPRLGRWVDWGDVAALADVAILAAQRPTAVLPVAMCQMAGLPIVNASFGSAIATELLGRAELQVDSHRPREIAKQIHTWLSNGEDLKRSAAVAKTFACENDRASRFFDRWQRLYEDVVVGRSESVSVVERDLVQPRV